MALAGNMLLLTYFVSKREQSASLIQALGVASNFILLSQVPVHSPRALTACEAYSDAFPETA